MKFKVMMPRFRESSRRCHCWGEGYLDMRTRKILRIEGKARQPRATNPGLV